MKKPVKNGDTKTESGVEGDRKMETKELKLEPEKLDKLILILEEMDKVDHKKIGRMIKSL